MNFSELFKLGSKILSDNGVEDYDFDAMCLIEHAFGFNRNQYFLNRKATVEEKEKEKFLSLINRRVNGEPLQYIIGKWGFMDGEFYVGDGVLIPRPDTEILVETAADYIGNNNVNTVFDLCAGSGCIGLTVARLVPHSRVFLIEKSDDAMKYLVSNKNKFNLKNVDIISGDIFNGFDSFQIPEPDLILSNPPYINSDEILSLQSEVLKEPVMALDGGIDGLDFYKAIADKWIKSCNSSIAVECGEGQAESIKKLFSFHCSEIFSISDFNGIERVVVGRKDIK